MPSLSPYTVVDIQLGAALAIGVATIVSLLACLWYALIVAKPAGVCMVCKQCYRSGRKPVSHGLCKKHAKQWAESILVREDYANE